MMPERIPEEDWLIWRELAPQILHRYCESVVQDASRFASQPGTGHEKYLALFKFISAADEHVAAVFDDRRRSNALFQIAGAVVRGMLTEKELAAFSRETQERVRRITGG